MDKGVAKIGPALGQREEQVIWDRNEPGHSAEKMWRIWIHKYDEMQTPTCT